MKREKGHQSRLFTSVLKTNTRDFVPLYYKTKTCSDLLMQPLCYLLILQFHAWMREIIQS